MGLLHVLAQGLFAIFPFANIIGHGRTFEHFADGRKNLAGRDRAARLLGKEAAFNQSDGRDRAVFFAAAFGAGLAAFFAGAAFFAAGLAGAGFLAAGLATGFLVAILFTFLERLRLKKHHLLLLVFQWESGLQIQVNRPKFRGKYSL